MGACDCSASDLAQQHRCPWCGFTRIVRNGSFRLRSGERVQRYLCKTCERTFSPLSGGPAYRIRKLEEWNESVQLLREELSLRQAAARLGISVSTAFRWRHRALAVLSRQRRRPLGGRVGVRMFHVKYSEKGSRVCNGPGSWGYWNFVRRGPEPEWYVRPRRADGARKRFRLLVDGRPVGVLVAQSDQGYEVSILGQGRVVPEFLRKGLAQVVDKGAHVFAFGRYEFKAACESLGLDYHDGIVAAAEWWRRRKERSEASSQDVADPGPVGCPAPADSWLRRFKGVATRYLPHYLAWFRDIARFPRLAEGVTSDVSRTLALLLASHEYPPAQATTA